MEKLCNVVMLATDKSNKKEYLNDFEGILKGIGRSELNGLLDKLSITKKPAIGYVTDMWEPQHLYITSNDEIKEDDYAILNNERIIKVGTNWSEQINKESLKEYAFKIIATTDPELHKDGVAKIGLPFIEKYITAYNKGNIIKEVNVEYIDFFNCEGKELWPITVSCKPKLREDGTIIIYQAKKYSQAEVDELLDQQAAITTAQVLENVKNTMYSPKQVVELFSKLQHEMAQQIIGNRGEEPIIPLKWLAKHLNVPFNTLLESKKTAE